MRGILGEVKCDHTLRKGETLPCGETAKKPFRKLMGVYGTCLRK